ncbi:hypothetical protein [Sphaerisporangium aureirubrum]|uniref:Uncharacterized protein n=1 Tax=Sphaerisporangium aureirubrum TaxID=1544736 RepID=A0ABW1NE43_9ACTN
MRDLISVVGLLAAVAGVALAYRPLLRRRVLDALTRYAVVVLWVAAAVKRSLRPQRRLPRNAVRRERPA